MYEPTSANLDENHPFFWAETYVRSMSRAEHDAEHARMGGNIYKEDRAKHLIAHIILKEKEGTLSDEHKELWEQSKSQPWFLPYAEMIPNLGKGS